MKKSLVLILLFAAALAGCETLGEGTKKGAGIGALTGAAIGGIVGHQDGHAWEGALIGGAAGALSGGLIGYQMDKYQAANNANYIPIDRIVEMASKGMPDDLIISEIDRTHSVYKLTSEIITYLKNNNVSDKVIDHMMQTAVK